MGPGLHTAAKDGPGPALPRAGASDLHQLIRVLRSALVPRLCALLLCCPEIKPEVKMLGCSLALASSQQSLQPTFANMAWPGCHPTLLHPGRYFPAAAEPLDTTRPSISILHPSSPVIHFPDGLLWSEGWVVAMMVGVRVTNLDIVITCLPCYGEYTVGVDSGAGVGAAPRSAPRYDVALA